MGLEYNDVTELSKNLQRAADYAPRVVDKWLHRVVGPALVDEMKMRAPVDSGHLKDEIVQTDAPRQVTVGPRGVDYNAFVVAGTRPHIIRSKKGKYLAFKVGGKMVYARQVNHPGTKPNPYMTESADAVMQRVTPQLTGLTVKVLKTGVIE